MSEEGKIDSMMNENRVFNPSHEFSENALIKNLDEYKKIYQESIENPEKFWGEKAEAITWFKKWDSVFKYTEKPFVKWFDGGKINVAYNCLDRHLLTERKNKAAIIWVAENGWTRTFTYQQLHDEVCRFSNVLKKKGVGKGDRVAVYLPMIPEIAITILACARIGAIHSVVFAGYSAGALQKRIHDCEAKVVVTSDGTFRAGKKIPLKIHVDEALENCPTVETCIVVKRIEAEVQWKEGRDVWWHDEYHAEDITPNCKCEEMDSEDPFFILYTSGTTGTPKGILHTQAGYLTWVYWTFKWVFDYKDNDTFWCTADVGWITGHSYIVYGPLANGATSLMFEGVPSYPDPGRFWQIVEENKVNIFYTAPTVVRALMKEGDEWPKKYDLSSLRVLGSVGEPINPEAWLWYYNHIGGGRCPIVDTYWQTETGGFLITPFPGATPLKPGSATLPFPGIDAAIFNEAGEEAPGTEGGYLVVRKPWPGIGRTVWNNPERYKKTYFGKFENIYLTGDGAKRDEDGYFWVMGRLDDVINVSGHRIGTMEAESALVSHESVAESACVGFPHEIKGQGLYAFVILRKGFEGNADLVKNLRAHVGHEIGPISKPDKIQFVSGLPKTRSGKIMRRVLKKIAAGESELGDTSTLADPSIVDKIAAERL